jgi:nucleotide-binding universal stress UspA family protein
MAATKRMIWAFDPVHAKDLLQRNAARTLALLHERLGFEIEPVHVRRPMVDEERVLAQSGSDEGVAQSLERLRRGRLPLPGMLPVRILRAPGSTLSASVEALHEYARRSGASLILVNTHGRHGIRRLSFGSLSL